VLALVQYCAEVLVQYGYLNSRSSGVDLTGIQQSLGVEWVKVLECRYRWGNEREREKEKKFTSVAGEERFGTAKEVACSQHTRV